MHREREKTMPIDRSEDKEDFSHTYRENRYLPPQRLHSPSKPHFYKMLSPNELL